MCDVKKMFLFVLKRDKICFGGILDNFCHSVQSVVGWNLGGAFLVVIFSYEIWGGHFFWGGTLGGEHFGAPPDLGVPPDINTMCWKMLVENLFWKSFLEIFVALLQILVEKWLLKNPCWKIFVGNFCWNIFVGTFLMEQFCWNIFVGTYIFVGTLKILVANPCCNSLLKNPWIFQQGFPARISNKDFQQRFSTRMFQQGNPNKDFSTRKSQQGFFNKD